MKTFEEWKEDYGLVWESNYCRATDQDCEAAWNASAENSAEEIAKRDERIAEIESRLNEVALDWQMLAAALAACEEREKALRELKGNNYNKT